MNILIKKTCLYSKKTLSILTLFFFMSVYSGLAVSAKPLNINTATIEQLVSVMNGVGVKKAEAIIEYRNQNGDFSVLDDLIFVKGIGPALLEKNREMLSIDNDVAFEAVIPESENL